MEKTPLLSYVLDRAEELQRADAKTSLTANYAIVALIEAILAHRAGTLPEALQGEAVKTEIETAELLLTKHKPVTAELKEALLAAIHAEEYRSQLDEFLFRKSLFRIREEAKAEGSESLGAVLYFRVLLENPPAVLKVCLGIAEEEPPRKPTAAQPSATAETGNETGAPAAAPAAAPTPPPKAPFSLEAIVKKTVDIQRALLDKVYGQDQAVAAFASGCFQGEIIAATEKKHRGPLATFLFAGPPGVGKTYLAETAAEALGLPFLRVDMSEYADDDSLVEFCGSDNVYKNGKEGNITKFVKENPHSVILFDEIEKAHISIIHLFLQILDAGSIRDNFSDKQVSFGNVMTIFTTNVGRKLYEDPAVQNLATIPRKKVLDALATERDPNKGTLMFPTAICSRFASGNVLMFNRLGTDNLYAIAKREIENHTEAFMGSSKIEVEVDTKLPTALIFSAGGKADARTVRGRAATIFHEEMYELLRLMNASGAAISNLKRIRVEVSLDKCAPETAALFVSAEEPSVLVFAEPHVVDRCRAALKGVDLVGTDDIDTAKSLLYNHDFLAVLADVRCHIRDEATSFLNAEDIDSVGQDFINSVIGESTVPVYLLSEKEGDITPAEFLSFARSGVRDMIFYTADDFCDRVKARCEVAYQQRAIATLARDSKVLSYKTAQTVSADGSEATISFVQFRLSRSTDSDDTGRVMETAARPSIRFTDVIGAEDAKRELGYFSAYLKDPRRYTRQGLHAPKGVLLYGPPGTGKTMLAKALAGESDVAFLATEGNRFLKRYVGEGPAAVHDLFATARKYAPAIVFIDEIDAIGKDRSEGHNDEHSGDILTALLTEMDGFNQDPNRPVFVLAATNYAVDKADGKTLDPALMRRFDRRIYVDLPNKEERLAYCKVRRAKSPAFAVSDGELENMAIRSVGMSLAQLEQVFEMALRNAVHSLDGTVTDGDIEEAFETYTSGEKRTRTADSVRRTACHEAGHALLCWLAGECPSYLTVVSRGDHGGYMQHGDTEDKGVYTKADLLARIRTSLAGRAAELVYYGNTDGVTTGPSGDLASATDIAERMICSYGMDEVFGLSAFTASPAKTPYYTEVRRRTNEILGAELAAAVETVEKNRPAIDALVAALVEKNQLKGPEIDEILKATVKQ